MDYKKNNMSTDRENGGETKGQARVKRGSQNSRMLRAHLDLLALCRPPPPDYMRVISGTGRGALALFFASHDYMSLVSRRCHPIVIRLQRTGGLASLRSAPRMFGSALGAMRLPQSIVGMDLFRRYRAPLCRVSAPHMLCLWITSPGARVLGMSFSSTIGLSTCLKSSCLKRGLPRGGTCGRRSTVFDRELLDIVLGMWFG
jgi:hypothetical protein